MKTAIIVHGMPSKEEYLDPTSPAESNKHWLPWVQRQLQQRGILTHIPDMPVPYEPDYTKWAAVFEQYPINEHTILVGHSCGAGFLLRWLSEHTVRVHKVALVAPWIDPHHTAAPAMFDAFQVQDISDRADALCLFTSSDDEEEMILSAEQIKASITGLRVQQFTDRGHFTFNDMNTEQFPEFIDFLVA